MWGRTYGTHAIYEKCNQNVIRNLEGRRPLERYVRRREDNTEVDIKKIESEMTEWMYLPMRWSSDWL
jgi:hypothetical protein